MQLRAVKALKPLKQPHLLHQLTKQPQLAPELALELAVELAALLELELVVQGLELELRWRAPVMQSCTSGTWRTPRLCTHARPAALRCLSPCQPSNG